MTKKNNLSADLEKKMFESAMIVQKNSYSPYSQYKVAASVLFNSGKIFAGINVENASYGATNCAERSAIFAAVSAGERKIDAVLVLTNEKVPWAPCGLCRQVIAEFANPNAIILLANQKGIQKKLLFSDVFPNSFDKKDLKL
ncbi:MAG: cytidine deaminase [Bdellovibrionota bacterium]